MPRLPRLLALLAVLAGVAALAACGGSSGGSGGDADALLASTFSGGRSVHSGKVDLSLTLNLRGLPQLRGPLDIRVSGPFDRPGPRAVPRFDFSLTAGLSGQSLTAGAVSVGDRGWLRFQGRSYAIPAATFRQFQQGFQKAATGSTGKPKTTFAALGIDPRRWLKDPRTEGTEAVGGVETDHVSSQIDVDRFLADLNRILAKASSLGAAVSTRLSDSQRRDIADAVKSARFDVWSGKGDHILRRLALRLGFEVPAAKRKSAGGLQSGDVSFRLQLNDVNRPQTIRAPANARPLSELTKALGQLGGLLGGTGSSGSSGGSGSSSGSTDDFQRYSQCVGDAGGDIAKVQRCADLLNG